MKTGTGLAAILMALSVPARQQRHFASPAAICAKASLAHRNSLTVLGAAGNVSPQLTWEHAPTGTRSLR
jgi:phosphatidylethanolamine-binding protein (PEBP) family uncharacterized protein